MAGFPPACFHDTVLAPPTPLARTFRPWVLGLSPDRGFLVKAHVSECWRDCVSPWSRAVVDFDTVVGEDGSSHAAESSPLAAHGVQSISQCRLPARAHLLWAPRPHPPLVLWGRQRGKQSETERGLLSRRETRDMWELAGEACEAGRIPGQPGPTGGCLARWEGSGAGLGHIGRIWGRVAAQPAPFLVVLGFLQAQTSLGCLWS